MCARYETLPDDLPEPFSQTRLTWVSPRLNETQREMFPGYIGPVIRLRSGEPGLDAMRWGLIPFWSKDVDPKKHRNTFNARAETIDTMPSFREAFARRRCLVPAASFFEFPRVHGRKVRHRITAADGGALMFAGIWDRCVAEDEEVYSYSIVTTDPADELRWIHNRIPVVLRPDSWQTWLDGSVGPDGLKAMLVSPETEALTCISDEETDPPGARNRSTTEDLDLFDPA